MTKDKIQLAHDFLKEHLFASDVDEADKVYRYEHSIRVYHLGEMLVEKEAYDETVLLLSCLLHDVGKFDSPSEIEHGRVSSKVARPFLETLNLRNEEVEATCACIAMHVDGEGSIHEAFQKEADALSDCDNLDRMGAYRVAEGLLYDLSKTGNLSDMEELVLQKIARITRYKKDKIGSSETANELFDQLFEHQLTFNHLLLNQIKTSKFD